MFEAPRAATTTLVLVNLAMFAICLGVANGGPFSSRFLAELGAVTNDTLVNQDYWRLIAHAFLHANPLHIFFNMICLVSWGGVVEQRIGATYFLIIYLASAIGGGVASIYGYNIPFSTVGASGAISGLVGALLCLTVLRRMDLSPQFFLINIGLNAFLISQLPQINWLAHLGGFIAGIAVCAVLDQLEALNRYWLKCTFPEFVKLSIGAIFASLIWLSWPPTQLHAAVLTVAGLAAIKAFDITLSLRRGLAIAVVAATALFVAVPLLLHEPIRSGFMALCRFRPDLLQVMYACDDASIASVAIAALIGVIAATILMRQFIRGVRDVGFIAQGFIGSRQRRKGI